MRDWKTIFGEQILLKWDHCLQRIKKLNIYCVIYISNKYAWVKSLKDKKGETVINAFI